MSQASAPKLLIALAVAIGIGVAVAWAGSQDSVSYAGYPVYALCAGLAYVVNWLVFIPSGLNKTEKFFDLTGGITYITVIIVAMTLAAPNDARAWLAAVLVCIWALRLATFLFIRISKDGKDGRFDEIKTRALRFFLTWTLQGLWVLLTAAAALAIITDTDPQPLGWVAWVGLAVWIVGFAIEAVADHQKSQFKKDPDNEGEFINEGLWAWSRHPNYFGEIVIWVGMAIIAVPVLNGWQWVALISPVFVTILLTKISGIPMLEQRADDRWGDRDDYQRYKQNTPVLIPKPPKLQ